MKLLLDTHILLALLEEGSVELPKHMIVFMQARDTDLFVSTASLWEIAIKVRARRLSLGIALDRLAKACEALGAKIIAIEPRHVLAEATPAPATRDPFDRLLIAQAECEDMRLVTLDSALLNHPQTWRPTA